MSGAETWDDANAAFLGQALAWLRAMLAPEKPLQKPPPEPKWEATSQPIPALLLLRARCGLSVFETKILLLCAAMELDPAVAELGAPSFALCLRLFADPSWDALSPHQPLRALRLIECDTRNGGPLVQAPLRTDERIVHFLKGLNEIDRNVAACLLPPPQNADAGLAPSQQAAVTALADCWRDGESPVAILTGNDPAAKLRVAAAAAASLGCLLCRSTLDLLPQGADLASFEQLWRREQVLLPLALLIEVEENEAAEVGAQGGGDAATRRLLLRLDGPLALINQEPPRLARPTRTIAVDKPTRAEQASLWMATLGAEEADFATALAGHFSLSGTAIPPLAARGREMLWAACRESLRPRLDRLAQRMDLRAGWSDLVLPPDREALLHQLADQVRNRRRVHDEWGFAARTHRGLGIGALFAGESGTGKTLAAEVLAASLELDLYRIDLAGVVSKYIGETEKNLRRLFDAAEDSGAILLFDEADALFGKRSEVRDSHDRYANIEVNYLLQRIEAYRGLAILATNLRSALDPAFLRRLRFVITFPYPGPTERQAIWRRAFPPAAKLGLLDWAQLARLNLTGGNIATVAINAAFLASAEGSVVQMRHVLAAARAEYVKLDRPFREADFQSATLTPPVADMTGHAA